MLTKPQITKYLDKHITMSLATVKGRQPHICTVYYAHDKHLNLYFASSPSSQHALEINSNQQVACAIADSEQLVKDRKLGLQIHGTCRRLTSKNDLLQGLRLLAKFPDLISKMTLASLLKGQGGLYRVQPTRIKILNEKNEPKVEVLDW